MRKNCLHNSLIGFIFLFSYLLLPSFVTAVECPIPGGGTYSCNDTCVGGVKKVCGAGTGCQDQACTNPTVQPTATSGPTATSAPTSCSKNEWDVCSGGTQSCKTVTKPACAGGGCGCYSNDCGDGSTKSCGGGNPNPTNTPNPGDPTNPPATTTPVVDPTAPPTATPTKLPVPPEPTIPATNMKPVCTDNGWSGTFTWTKPDFPANPITNFILRIDLINRWMENKPTGTSVEDIMGWTRWIVSDGSDRYIYTGNVVEKKVTLIPFRPYYGWSIQSIGTDGQQGGTAIGNGFSCNPSYAMVPTDRTTSCYDTNGNIINECGIEKFIAEYRSQHGYTTSPTVGDRKDFNLVTGKNAYKFDTVLNGGTQKELIDLLDFEAWRKQKFNPNATPTPTPIQGPTVPPNSILGVFVSDNFSCAMKGDSRIGCWGDNELGELGNGTYTAISNPIMIDTKGAVLKTITTGRSHSCAVTTTGGVMCWGANSFGQTGIADSRLSIPVNVAGLGDETITSIGAGNSHSCALTDSGKVKCWGANSFGQLGSGAFSDSRYTPAEVVELSGIVKLATGTSHSCALTSQGGVKCWGDNAKGQLGNGTTTKSSTPQVAQGLSDVKDIATIGNSVCALTDIGTVFCWGENTSGQLGDGTKINKIIPTAIVGLNKVASISMGYQHSCATLNDGSAVCWGKNDKGQLGNGKIIDSLSPVVVTGLTNVKNISLGYQHTCALTNNGGVKCWGINNKGQLGNGTTDNSSSSPVDVDGLTSGIDAMTSGLTHTCALSKTANSIKCWGDNSKNQLGSGTPGFSLVPIQVIVPMQTATGTPTNTQTPSPTRTPTPTNTPGPTVTPTPPVIRENSIAMTLGAICRINKPSNALECWGNNQYGQASPPTDLGQVKQIAGDMGFFCAINIQNKVRCWGSSNQDHLSIPEDLGSVNYISIGGGQTCVITANDNLVRCWGYNGNGEASPPSDLGPVKLLSAGSYKTCAVRLNDTFICWGSSYEQPPNDTGAFKQMEIEFGFSCGILSNDTALCWGQTVDGGAPVPATLGVVKRISVGSVHICAIRADDKVSCWGPNHTSPPSDLGPVDDIISTDNNSCAIVKNSNSVRCWGPLVYDETP